MTEDPAPGMSRSAAADPANSIGGGGPTALDISAPTATGLHPRSAAALAYAAWWLTGALFLVLEPTHPFVRFHARQAFVVFGLISTAGIVLWLASLLSIFASPALFRLMAVVAPTVWVLGVVTWATCLVQAARGRWWRVPVLGRLVP